MVVERRCINLYSDMNSWMDLVLLVNDEDFDKAKEVTEKAFDDFWNDPKVEEECWCYGDWVGWKLKEAGIKYNWCTDITIKNPKTKKELIETLHEKMWELYDDFDVEEETYLMLEAKRNGFQGVPGVVDLVHNEEYKENALKEFAEKLRDLL